MRPLTEHAPKPLLPVCGKPILEHLLSIFPDEVTEVIFVVGYLGDQIRTHFGKRYGRFTIRYAEQREQLGNYHALETAVPFLRKGERFLLMFADDLFRADDIAHLVAIRRPCILVSEVADPRRFGVVALDEQGNVREIVEKPEHPATNLAYCGPAVFTSTIFEYRPALHAKGEYFITDAVMQMVRREPVVTVRAGFWFPIGFPEDLKKAERVLCPEFHA